MSVIRPKLPEDPLDYAPAPLPALPVDGLAEARAAVADATLAQLPDRLLAEYNGTSTARTRATSQLYAVLQTARRIRDSVDRVIVLGDVGTTRGVRSIFASCCHPFHNELSRGERGGRPRLSFVSHDSDGDLLQGLVDLVAPPGAVRGCDLLDQWAVVICGDVPSTATGVLLPLLLQSVAGDQARLEGRVVSMVRTSGIATDAAPETDCPQVFAVTDEIHGGRGVLSAAGLLPAAIVGVDVVRLLQGAAAMNRRYHEAAPEQNPVLQLAAASRLANRRLRARPRLVSEDTERLDDLVRWHDQLFTATSRVAAASGAAPVIRLVAGEPRRDPRVAVPHGQSAGAAGALGRLTGLGAAPPPADTEPPSADAAVIRLPRIDEHTIGQLLQMLLLAAMVEEQLVD